MESNPLPLFMENALETLTSTGLQDHLGQAHSGPVSTHEPRELTWKRRRRQGIRVFPVMSGLSGSNLIDEIPQLPGEAGVTLPSGGRGDLEGDGIKPLLVTAPVALDECLDLLGLGHSPNHAPGSITLPSVNDRAKGLTVAGFHPTRSRCFRQGVGGWYWGRARQFLGQKTTPSPDKKSAGCVFQVEISSGQ